MARIIAYEGAKFTIGYARDRSGESPAHVFFESLGAGDVVKMMALFQRLGDHGNFMNKEKFRDLGEGLYEFKSFQIRMIFAYCRKERAVVVLTHGFIKKQDRTPNEELARARRIFEEDQNRLSAKKLSIVRKLER